MPGPREQLEQTVVLILGGGKGTRLEPLTRLRSKPAVPIAGKYRLIDVPISNAINSGFKRMYVLTQFNSVSLHRHIGQTYRFDAFSGGFVQILAAQQTPGDDRWFQGTADAVRRNLDAVRDLRAQQILILSGDHLYRMNYGAMLREHLDSRADVTIGVLPCSESEIAEFGAVRIDGTGRVVEFREKPSTAEAREGMAVPRSQLAASGASPDRPYLASMGIYLYRRQALEEALANEMSDFGRHVMPSLLGRLRVQAHLFPGYWRDIGTIKAFYDAHMDMVRPDPPFDFHDPAWPFYTHPRFLPGTVMDGCVLERSMVAEGATLERSEIRGSVIGVRSRVVGAGVARSLVMGADDYRWAAEGAAAGVPVGIGPGSVIEGAIVDKNACIGRDVRITNADGRESAEGDGWVIRDGVVVVAKGATIPDGTVI